MKRKIYLVGQISYNEKTYEWREIIWKYYRHSDNFEVINPCNCMFSSEALKLNNDNESFNNFETSKNLSLIPLIDYTYVKESNIIIVNMNHYSKEKPMIGSFFELAWCALDPGKIVIGIFDGNPEDDYQCKNPFVSRAVNIWVKYAADACDLIDYHLL